MTDVRKDDSLLKLRQQLMKALVLALDGWGVSMLMDQRQQDLLEIELLDLLPIKVGNG